MVLGRYLVDAVVQEGRSPSELARSHGVSRTWVYELVKRFRRGGYAALEPRSRRPRSCPHQFRPELEAVIVLLRGQLAAAGHDCGPHTIAQHLRRQGLPVPAVSTVWRILHRHGLITPQPQKRPRSSFVRFEAALNMLCDGASVTDACFDCGFSNLSLFSRQFKARFGESPSCVVLGDLTKDRLTRRSSAMWLRKFLDLTLSNEQHSTRSV